MKTQIIDRPIGISKKLSGIKFEEAFDSKTIHNAEKALLRSEGAFKEAATEDFKELSAIFSGLTPEWLDETLLKKISVYAFSIKSRAGTGGLNLASEVANSMYKFCDEAIKGNLTESFDVLKLHFNALNEIFSGKFPLKDLDKCQKLIMGLDAVVKKRLSTNVTSQAS